MYAGMYVYIQIFSLMNHLYFQLWIYYMLWIFWMEGVYVEQKWTCHVLQNELTFLQIDNFSIFFWQILNIHFSLLRTELINMHKLAAWSSYNAYLMCDMFSVV